MIIELENQKDGIWKTKNDKCNKLGNKDSKYDNTKIQK